MSYIHEQSAFETRKVLDILTRERAMALSEREWKHRLIGYGYRIRETDHGQVVTSAAPGLRSRLTNAAPARPEGPALSAPCLRPGGDLAKYRQQRPPAEGM